MTLVRLKIKDLAELKPKSRGKSCLIMCTMCPRYNFSEDEMEGLGKELKADVVKSPMLCSRPEIRAEGYDAYFVLSCGAGVQVVSEKFDTAAIPVCDTTGIGVKFMDKLVDYCSACGNCIIADTAGICPITRCAKGMLNGPCGGVSGGVCEVPGWGPCAWALIFEKMKNLGTLDRFIETRMPK